MKNYFEIVHICWNNSAYLLSLNNREIIIVEFSSKADARYCSPYKHFYRVTAKKNVHFRPGIIHFLPARWAFYIGRYFFYEDIVMKIGGDNMPRMSKKDKEDWGFFLDENSRISYNELCRKCDRDCKQSFRAVIVSCPEYNSKRRKQKK